VAAALGKGKRKQGRSRQEAIRQYIVKQLTLLLVDNGNMAVNLRALKTATVSEGDVVSKFYICIESSGGLYDHAERMNTTRLNNSILCILQWCFCTRHRISATTNALGEATYNAYDVEGRLIRDGSRVAGGGWELSGQLRALHRT